MRATSATSTCKLQVARATKHWLERAASASPLGRRLVVPAAIDRRACRAHSETTPSRVAFPDACWASDEEVRHGIRRTGRAVRHAWCRERGRVARATALRPGSAL